MSLKNLIALQQKKAGANHNAKPAPLDEADGNGTPAREQAQSSNDSTVADQLSESNAPAQPAPPKVGKGLGLNLLGAGRAVGGGRSKESPARVQPSGSGASVQQRDSGEDDGAVFGLADLAGFDASDDSAPTRSYSDERFLDEIEATAPERAITPDLTPQQMNFIESLDSIYPVLHDPDLFAQAVRIIMLELQENREYKKLISDQDVSTMIRGMRNTMGLAKIRKQEKSRKSSGGSAGKSSRAKKSAVSDDDMALLESLMGGGSFD
jgi:hypothetical protein